MADVLVELPISHDLKLSCIDVSFQDEIKAFDIRDSCSNNEEGSSVTHETCSNASFESPQPCLPQSKNAEFELVPDQIGPLFAPIYNGVPVSRIPFYTTQDPICFGCPEDFDSLDFLQQTNQACNSPLFIHPVIESSEAFVSYLIEFIQKLFASLIKYANDNLKIKIEPSEDPGVQISIHLGNMSKPIFELVIVKETITKVAISLKSAIPVGLDPIRIFSDAAIPDDLNILSVFVDENFNQLLMAILVIYACILKNQIYLTTRNLLLNFQEAINHSQVSILLLPVDLVPSSSSTICWRSLIEFDYRQYQKSIHVKIFGGDATQDQWKSTLLTPLGLSIWKANPTLTHMRNHHEKFLNELEFFLKRTASITSSFGLGAIFRQNLSHSFLHFTYNTPKETPDEYVIRQVVPHPLQPMYELTITNQYFIVSSQAHPNKFVRVYEKDDSFTLVIFLKAIINKQTQLTPVIVNDGCDLPCLLPVCVDPNGIPHPPPLPSPKISLEDCYSCVNKSHLQIDDDCFKDDQCYVFCIEKCPGSMEDEKRIIPYKRKGRRQPYQCGWLTPKIAKLVRELQNLRKMSEGYCDIVRDFCFGVFSLTRGLMNISIITEQSTSGRQQLKSLNIRRNISGLVGLHDKILFGSDFNIERVDSVVNVFDHSLVQYNLISYTSMNYQRSDVKCFLFERRLLNNQIKREFFMVKTCFQTVFELMIETSTQSHQVNRIEWSIVRPRVKQNDLRCRRIRDMSHQMVEIERLCLKFDTPTTVEFLPFINPSDYRMDCHHDEVCRIIIRQVLRSNLTLERTIVFLRESNQWIYYYTNTQLMSSALRAFISTSYGSSSSNKKETSQTNKPILIPSKTAPVENDAKIIKPKSIIIIPDKGVLAYKVCASEDKKAVMVTYYVPPTAIIAGGRLNQARDEHPKFRVSQVMVVDMEYMPELFDKHGKPAGLNRKWRPRVPPLLTALHEFDTNGQSDHIELKRVCPKCRGEKLDEEGLFMKMRPCGHVICSNCFILHSSTLLMKKSSSKQTCPECKKAVEGAKYLEKIDLQTEIPSKPFFNYQSAEFKVTKAYSFLSSLRFEYHLGHVYHCDNYTQNLEQLCGSGFHCFMEIGDEAFRFAEKIQDRVVHRPIETAIIEKKKKVKPNKKVAFGDTTNIDIPDSIKYQATSSNQPDNSPAAVEQVSVILKDKATIITHPLLPNSDLKQTLEKKMTVHQVNVDSEDVFRQYTNKSDADDLFDIHPVAYPKLDGDEVVAPIERVFDQQVLPHLRLSPEGTLVGEKDDLLLDYQPLPHVSVQRKLIVRDLKQDDNETLLQNMEDDLIFWTEQDDHASISDGEEVVIETTQAVDPSSSSVPIINPSANNDDAYFELQFPQVPFKKPSSETYVAATSSSSSLPHQPLAE